MFHVGIVPLRSDDERRRGPRRGLHDEGEGPRVFQRGGVVHPREAERVDLS